MGERANTYIFRIHANLAPPISPAPHLIMTALIHVDVLAFLKQWSSHYLTVYFILLSLVDGVMC